jgi:hypothetical protein
MRQKTSPRRRATTGPETAEQAAMNHHFANADTPETDLGGGILLKQFNPRREDPL